MFSGDDLAGLRALIAQHPDWHRTALSRHLCELWDWRNGAGRLKDMAARTLLLKLHTRGMIELPPPQTRTNRPCAQAPPVFEPELLPAPPTPIDGSLASLQPVRLELAHTPGLRRRVRQLLAQYHYRGFNGAVGENVQYLARDIRGRELAVMVFGAAAWKVAVRDRFIGWSAVQRQQRLGALANQQRFLILPWVRVKHLASYVLGQAARRVGGDWQQKYGHGLDWLETFVDRGRYRGSCYRAANWDCVGQTQGRSRQDRDHDLRVPVKDVYLYAVRKGRGR